MRYAVILVAVLSTACSVPLLTPDPVVVVPAPLPAAVPPPPPIVNPRIPEPPHEPYPVPLPPFISAGISAVGSVVSPINCSCSVFALERPVQFYGIVAPNQPASYAWSFGDGTRAVTSTGSISHQYRLPNLYRAEVVITAASGAVNADSVVFQVY